MYISDFWASLVRRWYLVVAGLIVTAGLVYVVSQAVPPTYESTADVVLVPPKSAEDPTANRYLSLGGLRQAVDVLTRSIGSDTTKDAVRDIAPDGKYEAIADFTTSAPILIVTAEAASPAAAQKLLDAVVEQVPINLRDLQDNVDIDSEFQIMPQMVASDEKPKAVNKKQIRAIGAVGALCLMLCAMVVGAVDNRVLRRENREEESARANPKPITPPVKKKRAPDARKRDVVSARARR